jgi:serine/threonine protein kinase
MYYINTKLNLIRDLKPDNILVFLRPFKTKGILEHAIRNVKICDYGEADVIESGKTLKTLSTAKGTLKYMSSEMHFMNLHDLDHKHVAVDNFVCDIYRLGLIILEVGFAQMKFPPVPTKSTMLLADNPLNFPCPTDASLLGPEWLRDILEENLSELASRYPEVPKPEMESLCNLIRHMLVYNANRRLSPKSLFALYNSYREGKAIPHPSI